MSDINKKKLFIPRKLSDDDSRYSEWNNSQKTVDGKRINQFDSEGRKQGIWEQYYDNGDLSVKGGYINGEMDGYWEFYWENGKISSKGSFINGDRDGIWESYYNGKLKSKGNYNNDKKEGIWEKYSNTGELEGKYLYEDGKLIKKIPLNESEEPKKKLFIPRKLSDDDSRYSDWNNSQPIKNGKPINQYDSEGRKQGYWEEYWVGTNKLNSKGFYKDDKQDGVWKHYHHKGDDILWYEESHKNGKLIKTLLYYYDDNGNIVDRKIYGGNGKLIKSLPITESKKLFIPRKLSGEGSRWSDWNKEQPIVDGVHINQYDMEGRKQGYWEQYFNNGKLESKGTYKNDNEEGMWEWYYENGELGSVGLCINDKRNGIWRFYRENGKLDVKGSYEDDKKNGLWEFYHPNGGLKSKKLFDDGELIKELPLTESKTPSFLLNTRSCTSFGC